MIRLRDVTVAYGDRVILDNINLDIHQGETLAILGASGSGKSTILRLIIGLQKPTKGQVFFHDEDITAFDEEQLTAVRRHMGMVFQYSALFDSMTVGENVAFGLRQHTKDDEATIQRIVKEKLRLVGLEGIEDMMPNDLSGGMKKRVSLAGPSPWTRRSSLRRTDSRPGPAALYGYQLSGRQYAEADPCDVSHRHP